MTTITHIIEGGNVKEEKIDDQSGLSFSWTVLICGLILSALTVWTYVSFFSLNAEMSSFSIQFPFKDIETLGIKLRLLGILSIPMSIVSVALVLLSFVKDSRVFATLIILTIIASFMFSFSAIGGAATNHSESFSSWAEQRYEVTLDESPVIELLRQESDSAAITYDNNTKIATLHRVDGKWFIYDNLNKNELPVKGSAP